MAGITWNRNPNDLIGIVNNYVPRLEERAERAVTAVTEQGAADMKGYIETRGTANSGKAGRIETGRMVDAVGVEETSNDNHVITGAFGWVDDTADYFVYQEKGTRSYRIIEPMFALRDAFNSAKNRLKSRLR